jgi:Zn-dependent M28 family amino/carboxypeptidase
VSCKNYLEGKLESFGWEVSAQVVKADRYDGASMTGFNIIGQYRPELNNRIILAAHWDSRFISDQDDDVTRQSEPVDGANDGASGVGVLLEIARTMRDNPIDLGVDIVFFDLEDQGEDSGNNAQTWALGAQHWARNTHTPPGNIKFGILLDMVGAKNARFGKEYYSMSYAPEIVNKVWRRAQSMGYNQYFVNDRVNGVTDDHYFVNTIANIPMINIIDFNNTRGFFEHWHTQGDDMSAIDAKTLGAVGQVLLAVLYKSAEGSF